MLIDIFVYACLVQAAREFVLPHDFQPSDLGSDGSSLTCQSDSLDDLFELFELSLIHI